MIAPRSPDPGAEDSAAFTVFKLPNGRGAEVDETVNRLDQWTFKGGERVQFIVGLPLQTPICKHGRGQELSGQARDATLLTSLSLPQNWKCGRDLVLRGW